MSRYCYHYHFTAGQLGQEGDFPKGIERVVRGGFCFQSQACPAPKPTTAEAVGALLATCLALSTSVHAAGPPSSCGACISLPGCSLNGLHSAHVAGSRAEGFTSYRGSAQQMTDESGAWIPQGGVAKCLSALAPGVPAALLPTVTDSDDPPLWAATRLPPLPHFPGAPLNTLLSLSPCSRAGCWLAGWR